MKRLLPVLSVLPLLLLSGCETSDLVTQATATPKSASLDLNKEVKNEKLNLGHNINIKRDLNMKDGHFCYILRNVRIEESGLVTLKFQYETLRGYKCKSHKIYDITSYPSGQIGQVTGIEDRYATDPFFVQVTPNTNSVSIKFLKSNRVIVQKYSIGRYILRIKKLIENECSNQQLDICIAEQSRPSWERTFRNSVSKLKGRAEKTPPTIILNKHPNRTDTYNTFIRGRVTDNEGVMTVMVNGRKPGVKADGTFASRVKLAFGKNNISVQAEDVNGNVAERKFTIIREEFIPEETLADVDMPPKTRMNNPNGVAVVIGVENYQYVSDATYAYNDAEVFREYLADTLGYKKSKIKIVTNSKATLAELNKLLGPNGWIARNVKAKTSDVVVYFSGHGIPDAKTKKTGLLPFDVDPNYSVGMTLRDLYTTLGTLDAKSVTVFLDTCFSGQGREKQSLLADARGIMVVPLEKNIPKPMTVLSAATAGQISGPLKDKEHGLFTYYVLKGLGGAADSNKDKQLTVSELGSYVQANVKEQAAAKGWNQTPELQGASERVLVQF